MINTIILGHALTELPKLPAESVSCVTTSPPYWSLRDYGVKPVIWDGDKDCEHEWGNDIPCKKESHHGEGGSTLRNGNVSPNEKWNSGIKGKKADSNFCLKCNAWRGSLGLEPDFNLYVKHLCDIFDEVKRILRKDGTCFVNIGDSYGGSGNASGHTKDTKNLGYKTLEMGATQGNQKTTRQYAKCLLDIPYRFSIEMINRGWIKRNTIIWWKPNCMPSSAPDRFTIDFEYLFFFTKNNKTLFWTNEKTLECVSKKPLGIKGIEGKDWEWRPCPACSDKNYFNYRTRDVMKKGKDCPQFKASNEEKENIKKEICPRCKGLRKVKYPFWSGHDYWFEQQFEPILTDSIKRELRGNRPNKYSKDKHLPKGVHPMTMSQVREYRGYDNLGQEILNRNGRNKRCVWIIPTQPFPEAHFACVDKDTEILTIDGWKKYTDIKWYKSSPHHILVATYNLESKIIEYQPLSYIKKYNCDGMVKVGNRDLDILMTENHRNIVKKKTGKEEIILAEDLSYSDKIRVLAPINYPENNGIGKTFAELIGWIISEGHYKKGGFIEIYQNENEKAKRIDYLLNKLEIPHTRNIRRTNQIIWYLKKSPLIDWCLVNIPNKRLNRFLVSLPTKEIKAMFNSLIAGDGHIRKDDNRISFIQKDKDTKDWFQILALRLGYHSIQGNKEVYLTKRTHIGIRNTNGRGKNIKIIPYNGKVWCPKTPNGTWVARRNGRIFITGNTFPEGLIEIPIKAGCPEFICKKCGKARLKIYKTIGEQITDNMKVAGCNKEGRYNGTEQKDYKPSLAQEPSETKKRILKSMSQVKESYYSDCGCNAGFEPGITLDPFMGSGSTALVALKQRKRFIGIEIKQEYIDMAYKRIARVQQRIF